MTDTQQGRDKPGEAAGLSTPTGQEPADCVKCAGRLGSAAAIIGALVLIGWFFGIDRLKSPCPAFVSMKANTALCFLLCGIALRLLSGPGCGRGGTFARLCAAAAALVGALTLGEYLFGLELGIDQALLRKPAGAVNTFIPGRMAWSTALNFLLCGAALALQDVPGGLRPARFMAVLSGAIAAFYTIAYFLGSIASSKLTWPPMAVYTSLVFMLIAAGVLLSRPVRGWVRLITHPTGNYLLTRRLLPGCIAAMLLIGWLRLAGQRAGLYDVEFGVAITVFSGITVITVLILRTAAALESRDRERGRLQAELVLANRELEAFCYSVSHDLRAPLRSIDGFSLALLEDYENKLDGEGREHLRRIRGGVQRMDGLIDDLLKLSRITRAELTRERLDLSALALEVVQELRKAQPERAVEGVIEKGILAEGDAGLLRIALENLLGNAWKFTGRRSGARVEFGAARSGHETTFFVRDNGAGFDMKYGGKLFNAFQRLHKNEDFPGTGVGLATVQRIVARHEGRVWAEAGIKKGATFFFTLGTGKETKHD